MRVHIDLLGWLHLIWGAFGLLTGLSLLILAAGAAASLAELGSAERFADPAVWVLGIGGLALILGGAAMAAAGRGLLRRRSGSRFATLILAAPNAVLAPFGTALGVYACWTLLNDDARRAFGRRLRSEGGA
ncbi:MAG TPA: hypothetical protein VFO19_05765 [Vicinamibacterales bacterium]|nr:hypothetical protein [Vicinamibacterales bacterium]